MSAEDEITTWSCHETVGVAIADVGTVVKIPITNEMWHKIQEKAAARGMDPNDYLDQLVDGTLED